MSISCILLIFTISGCKKKPADLPDHIKEKQARELKSKGQKKAKPVHDEDDGHGHAKGQEKREPSKEDFKEEEWPPEVLEAYRHAFSAGIVEMPEASRRLARAGLPAVNAMRRIITHHRLPVKKRAFVAMMLVQLHMFRVDDLIKFLKSTEMPYVQRASIEALGILGNDKGLEALKLMRAALEQSGEEERKSAIKKDPGAQNPYAPLVAFIGQALALDKPLGLTDKRLVALDQVYQSKTAVQLRAAISNMTSLSFEPGLVMLVGSPVASELVKVGASLKLIELAKKEDRRIISYAGPGYPPMLRMAAARFVLEKGDKKEVEQLAKLASDERDPLANVLQELLIKKPMLPGGKSL